MTLATPLFDIVNFLVALREVYELIIIHSFNMQQQLRSNVFVLN